MTKPPTPVEVARRLADAMEAGGISYALGGAIAAGYWGVPRATINIDINVMITPMSMPNLVLCLQQADCELDAQRLLALPPDTADLRVKASGYRVDLFLPSLELHEEAMNRRAVVPLLGRPVYVLSAEDITLFKLLWHRPKDLLDIERIIALQGDKLDLQYIRSWLKKLLAMDDERAGTFEALRGG